MDRPVRLTSVSTLLPVLWLGVTLGRPPVVNAQRVRVQTVEAETGRAVAGVVVGLVDSTGHPAARSITDQAGRAVLVAPRRATFRLRAERVGHPDILTEPFTVTTDVTKTLVMPAAPLAPLDDLTPKTAETTLAYGELQGRILSADGRAVDGADVLVPGLDSTFVSDQDGRFRVGDLPEGPVVIRIAAIGYAPIGLVFRISRDRRLVDTTLVLKPIAQPLAPLEVTAGNPPPVVPKLEEFERRRRFGIGTFVTRAVLAKWEAQPLSTALRTVRGVRMVPRQSGCGGGFAAASTRSNRGAPCLLGYGCPFAIYVDGARMYDGDGAVPNIDDFLTDRVEAIEVYRGAGEAPVEFNATGSLCGVLIIWTRISGN